MSLSLIKVKNVFLILVYSLWRLMTHRSIDSSQRRTSLIVIKINIVICFDSTLATISNFSIDHLSFLISKPKSKYNNWKTLWYTTYFIRDNIYKKYSMIYSEYYIIKVFQYLFRMIYKSILPKSDRPRVVCGSWRLQTWPHVRRR